MVGKGQEYGEGGGLRIGEGTEGRRRNLCATIRSRDVYLRRNGRQQRTEETEGDEGKGGGQRRGRETKTDMKKSLAA